MFIFIVFHVPKMKWRGEYVLGKQVTSADVSAPFSKWGGRNSSCVCVCMYVCVCVCVSVCYSWILWGMGIGRAIDHLLWLQIMAKWELGLILLALFARVSWHSHSFGISISDHTLQLIISPLSCCFMWIRACVWNLEDIVESPTN